MELRPDHDGDVEELHLGRRQTIESGAEQAVDGVDPRSPPPASRAKSGLPPVVAYTSSAGRPHPASARSRATSSSVRADRLITSTQGWRPSSARNPSQRVVEIGGRVSAREHEQRWRCTAQAGEVPQRIASRRRRPVHVLDDNEQRSLACGALQIVAQRRKDLRPLDRSFRLRPRRSEPEPRS